MDELKPCPSRWERAVNLLNIYRNAHYNDPMGESNELANAINDILPFVVNAYRRAATESISQEEQTVIQRAMKKIKDEHCGDYDCFLPENKLDDSGYWTNDSECKDCTYGACYRALERSLHTAAQENKPFTNFDHIAASPKSLAEFLQSLSNISFDNVFCHAQCDDDDNCPHELQCIVDWLNQPHKPKGSEKP